MSKSEGHAFLGDIPNAIRRRAISDLNSIGGALSFAEVNQPYVETLTEGLFEHILAGPWVDVDAAVGDLMYHISDSPSLAKHPRTLLLEDHHYPGGRQINEIVRNPRIGPMIALLENLNVVVLANLDFTQASKSAHQTFWTSIPAGQFRLQDLEIVQCTLSYRQLGWLVTVFAKDQMDMLRLHDITFSEKGSVPRALTRTPIRAKHDPLQVRELEVSILSSSSVEILSVLLDLPTSIFSARRLRVDAQHITPNIIAGINSFLCRQHVKELFFDVSRLSTITIENRDQLRNTPIRLVGLTGFHFECGTMNEVWNEGLLMLYHATLQRYQNTGLKWIHSSLFYGKEYTSHNPMRVPVVPQSYWLWTRIEILMAARQDIDTFGLSVNWLSNDNRVHEGRFRDALEDPASSRPHLMRQYYTVSLRSQELRRQLLRKTILRLFPNISSRVFSTDGQAADLSFTMQCNDGQHPSCLTQFSGDL
ncbi:hypothetical protein BDZ89DRAFT_620759 [Hymenopellis radicata]|nr:hypothetical protein BDZ89DRAFT_620759 [Hymenopellis radicata]